MRQFTFIYLFAVVFLTSCSQKKTAGAEDTPTSGVIAIASDDCLAPIIQEEISVFESIYKEAGIVPYFSGETETISRLLHDSTRLAVTTRRLNKEEVAFMNAKKLYPKAIQIATDAIALIVNKQNTDSLIGIPVIKDILTGKIKNWNEISEKNKSGKIEVVFDNPNSSTIRYAIDSICGGEQLNGNLQAAQNNYAVLDYVAKRPGALGIIGANWVSNPIDSTGLSFNDSIRVMAVSKYRNATIKNSFKPYQAYMALKDYPMTRPVYIILSDPRTGLASGFTSFVSSDRGQRIILKSGILPATQVIRLVNVRDQL
ncbi:PstS family phosphate ABC transporter substrate-binding protein [Parabacteroides sp. APC149_11_2_Y6]